MLGRSSRCRIRSQHRVEIANLSMRSAIRDRMLHHRSKMEGEARPQMYPWLSRRTTCSHPKCRIEFPGDT